MAVRHRLWGTDVTGRQFPHDSAQFQGKAVWRYPRRIDTRFRQAIDGLYTAFAAYPLREVNDGCPCCTSPTDNSDLHAAPLRELSTDHLRYYGFAAMFTWGDLDDFKHFLPRLFELAATEGFQGLDTESLYGRLAYSKFDTWPQTEQTAVRAFAMAHWRASLADEGTAYLDETTVAAEQQLRDWLDANLRSRRGTPR